MTMSTLHTHTTEGITMRYVAIIDGSVANGFERAGDAASFARRHVANVDEENIVAQLKGGEAVIIRASSPRVVLRKV